MRKSARKASPSTIANRTVPLRAPNSELRPREYLTEREIERLQEAARKRSRYGHRDATMILVTYRHGLRASEVCGLRWDQIELDSGRLHVRRAKGGIDNVHPLSGRKSEPCVNYVCHDRWLPQNDRSDWGSRKAPIPGPPTYAPALNWVQARQRWA